MVYTYNEKLLGEVDHQVGSKQDKVGHADDRESEGKNEERCSAEIAVHFLLPFHSHRLCVARLTSEACQDEKADYEVGQTGCQSCESIQPKSRCSS